MRPDDLRNMAAQFRRTAHALRELAKSELTSTLRAYLRDEKIRAAPAIPSDRLRETAALLDDFAETLETLARM